MNRPPMEVLRDALKDSTGREPVESGSGWLACCPAHDDHNPSLSVSAGNDGRVLLNCFAGCSTESVLAALGLTAGDLFPEQSGISGGSVKFQRSQGTSQPQKPRQTKRSKQTWPTSGEAIAALETKRGPRSAAWTYRDVDWNEVGIVLRWDRPDGGKDILPLTKTADGWQCCGMSEPCPLYRLSEVGKSDVVFVFEGEKAADAGCSIGLNVTTSSGGSNAADKSDWSPLAGKDVVIIPDNDRPGLKYAETVASIVTQLDPPASVRILDLKDDWPDLPDKGDLDDWCEVHDSTEPETLRERIETLVLKAELWVPNPKAETSSSQRRTRRAVLQRFSEVEPETLRWLWLGRIPSGMLTVVSGNPAGGKSFLMADMVARVTTGTDWPDGSTAEEPGDAILVNVEDAVAIVQRPRLDAAGADVGRVLRIDGVELTSEDEVIEQRTFCIMEAAEVLRSALEQLERPRLVILDPLAAFLAGVRSNDQGEIRSAFSPLVQLAEEFDVAIVFVHHNRKGTGSHSSERLSGSLQIGATVRQSWEVVRDPEDENRRLFLPGKNSNAKDRGGLAFQIVDSPISLSDDGDFVGKVEWQPGIVDLSADQAARFSTDDESSDSWPIEWLLDNLSDGPQPAIDVQAAARKIGISEKQLRTARTRLKVKSRKSDFKGGWFWELHASGLPRCSDSPPEAA